MASVKDKSLTSNFLKTDLKNIFTNSKICSENDLALMIYSTFLMTKAPYQRHVERSINLLNILKIHNQYDTEVGLEITPEEQFERLNTSYDPLTSTYKNYVKKLFSNDFYFDAKYCSNLGVFCDSIFKNKGLSGKISTEWLNILNKPWDKMATSTGLRGDPDELEDFWGQKGYFVVYKEVLNNEEMCLQFKKILEDDSITDDEKKKILKSLNKTQLENVRDRDRKGLTFHVVDKVQWRGSREIYVMDINTKSMQQPIEQFMSFLCKNLDNELISIPSDKRAQTIHHAIFEKDLPISDLKMYYLTLDCSKWAPKSVFVKFCNMILCMETIPSSFKTHFFNYISKLYKKTVYFNKSECKVLLNNINVDIKLKKYLIEDTKLGGYFIKMPYSWVMGIFNYTSSFMHAVNQSYSSYLINKTALLNFREDTSLVMFAHSDDSGGRMSARSKSLITRNLMHYEINLKCCNHILSKKKSVVSRLYFEILSVIYLFKKLLALLPKFLGGLRFLPTDKGVSQDLMQSYSKCIEVIIAGASFDIAYIVLKMYSMLVWRFYMNRGPISSDYDRPVQYLGMPDSHPINVLISGSSADIIRLLHSKGEDHVAKLISLSNKIMECSDEVGPIRPFKFNIQIRNIENKFQHYSDLFSKHINNWTIKNVNLKSTPFNALNFLSKLNDKGFMGSMVNESLTRRMSRAYYFRNSNTLITKNMNVNFKKVIETFNNFFLLTEGNELSDYLLDQFYIDKNELKDDLEDMLPKSLIQVKVLKNVLSSPLRLMRYMDEISLDFKDINKVVRTIKPTHLQVIKTGKAFSVDFDPAELVSYVKDIRMRWALPGYNKILTAFTELDALCKSLGLDLESLDENTLLLLCRNYTSKDVKEIYLYSQIPADLRVIKTYTGILSFLSTNSFRDMEISGLVLNLGRNLTDPAYVTTQISNETYLINTILNVLVIFTRKMAKIRLHNLWLNPLENIEWGGGTVSQFITWVENFQFSDVSYNLIRLNNDYIRDFNSESNSVNAMLLSKCSFYTFLKQQSSKDSWRGDGELLICISGEYFLMKLYNDRVVEVYTNCHGKINMQSSNYILDTLMQIGVKFNQFGLNKSKNVKSKTSFGFDHSGDLSNSQLREMNIGVPSFNLVGNIPFLENLEVYNLSFVHENLYLLNSNDEDLKSYKIYSLRPSLGGLIEVTKGLFNKKDFEYELVTGGLDSVTEFLYNDVLPDFGLEQYIKKEDFFNNYTGSKTYSIIHKVSQIDKEKIPKKMVDAYVPSPNGSLSRLLTYYEEESGEKIINSRKFLNAEILKIRNEYPESFSLILSERMVENYENMFNSREREEITNQYLKIAELEDHDSLKDKLVNLMCYWGYSSLVNVVATFNFVKEKKNYTSFKNITEKHPAHGFYVDVFPKFLKCLYKTVCDYSQLSRHLDFPLEIFKTNDFIDCFIKFGFCLAYDLYDFESPFYNISLNRLKFNNMIFALLKDDNFCTSLMSSVKNLPVINTLPIDYQNRGHILSIINCLSIQWMLANKIGFSLDSNPLVQRLPDDVPRPKKIVDTLLGIETPPISVYHHYIMPRGYLGPLNKKIKFRIGTTSYFVNSKFTKLSEVKIPVVDFFNIKRPLTKTCLESELWEEILSLIDMGDYCEEEVEDIFNDLGRLQYIPYETKIEKGKGDFRKIYTNVNVISIPASENKNYINYVRQIGENVIVFSPTLLLKFKNHYNSHIRLINVEGTELFAHILSSDRLEKDFWDELIGGDIFNVKMSVLDILMPTTIIDDNNEIKKINEVGAEFTDIFNTEGVTFDEGSSQFKEVLVEPESVEEQDDEDKGVKKEKESKVESDFDKYIKMLDEAELEGKISSQGAKDIKDKLMSIHETNLEIDDNYYLNQIIKQLGLGNIKKLLNSDLFSGLKREDKVKIFQAPSVFGLSRSGTQINKNIIKSKGLKAELYCISENLVNASLSGSLTISKYMKKLAKSSFRMWMNMLKDTRTMLENKKFLLMIFLLVFNDSTEASDDDFDNDWQELINSIQIFMTEGEDESEDEMVELNLTDISPFSKIKYRISGM